MENPICLRLFVSSLMTKLRNYGIMEILQSFFFRVLWKFRGVVLCDLQIHCSCKSYVDSYNIKSFKNSPAKLKHFKFVNNFFLPAGIGKKFGLSWKLKLNNIPMFPNNFHNFCYFQSPKSFFFASSRIISCYHFRFKI